LRHVIPLVVEPNAGWDGAKDAALKMFAQWDCAGRRAASIYLIRRLQTEG
jgi:hypothetical protein